MDKASIIKDAIGYIQELHDQEKKIQAELLELESGKSKKNQGGFGVHYHQELPVLLRSKKKKIDYQFCDFGGSKISPIELLEVCPFVSPSLMALLIHWFFYFFFLYIRLLMLTSYGM